MAKHDPLQGILSGKPKRLFFISKSGNKQSRPNRSNDPIQGVLFSSKQSPTQNYSAIDYRDSIYEGVRRSYVTVLDNFTLSELSEIAANGASFNQHAQQSRSDFIDMCVYMHQAMSNLKSLRN